jgi:hypothetical protein
LSATIRVGPVQPGTAAAGVTLTSNATNDKALVRISLDRDRITNLQAPRDRPLVVTVAVALHHRPLRPSPASPIVARGTRDEKGFLLTRGARLRRGAARLVTAVAHMDL